MLTPELIKAADVNTREWLVREALWAMAKSPLSIQWDRWVTHTDIEDPAGVLGLVVGGNLQRAEVNLSQAELFDEDSPERNVILGRVAEHVGKLAGGLVAIRFMVANPPEERNKPYANHIAGVITEVTSQPMLVKDIAELTDSTAYYEMLRPAHERVLKGPSSDEDWKTIRESVAQTANRSRTSWEKFLHDHPGALIVPGGTPRSGGSEIELLREQFEPYAQLVTTQVTN